MLIDEITLKVSAGKGGDGVVQFSGTMKTYGPTGGDGGRGGDVVLVGVADIGALRAFRSKKPIFAEDGRNGGQNVKTGHNGKDVLVRVPVGTVARNRENNKVYEILFVDQRITVIHGGRGGFGNFHFRSSRKTSPDKATLGKVGEAATLDIELKLIADIGFIGYPNVGKSSLMNALTRSSSKVGNYNFTTLEPHLGMYYGTLLADIPGLIEGASEGKGLGHKFLRHIERTRVLFHLVNATSEHPLLDYKNIRKELGIYNPTLLEKPEWVLVSRSDEQTIEEVKKVVRSLKRKNPRVLICSILEDGAMGDIRKLISSIAEEYTKEKKEEIDKE
ncbi:MAG: GTPase ObgE [Candidatus Moraniibacteriota bacterium]|nr:MAG: GTPase ObgE [Candidatus Moranbacteria bacterium]